MTTVYYPTPGAEANTYGANNPVISSPLVAVLDLLNTL